MMWCFGPMRCENCLMSLPKASLKMEKGTHLPGIFRLLFFPFSSLQRKLNSRIEHLSFHYEPRVQAKDN